MMENPRLAHRSNSKKQGTLKDNVSDVGHTLHCLTPRKSTANEFRKAMDGDIIPITNKQ